MKKNHMYLLAALFIFFGCNSNSNKEYAQTAEITADTTAVADLPKIIKTADMNFRVKDVQQTKELLSTKIKAEGGAIAEVSINSSIQSTDKFKLSADSLKEITAYRKEAYLVAKIPAEKLDDFTNEVAKMALFVNSQSLKIDDQSISYLANQMKVQNREEAVKQINKVALPKSNNVESSLYIKDDLVDKKIGNMDINNRVKYSTITLNFYQDNTIQATVIANDNLYDFKPGFFTRLWLNIVDGWIIFKEFILLLTKLWMLFVVAALIYAGIKYYKNRRRRITPQTL
ncbi:DUF4349 domain-containing protein [Pedobacter montanisoli]|uniref:DUF4349 domain-containing protein n=1 Tax=Pedobacter montanisoli TaxID=2923277 RepID=A0ABS9ZRS0_9SPHI|nr:DUF4349 domain-containing protein [Pedobacter montanisoli]MCJ0741289.1 DUF4349 domain-containing protein [Pedobacter montanisoli]